MASNLLTAKGCKNATANGMKVRKLHDGDGLYLWVLADGRKYWRERYWQREAEGFTEKSLSLGAFPGVTLKDAREKHAEIRKQLRDGLDPSMERKAEKQRQQSAIANSFRAVAAEWLEKHRRTWTAHYAEDMERRLKRNAFPILGDRPIDQISAPDLLMAIRRIESRGSCDLAHRVLQVCGQVFRYGIATGRCQHDLSADLKGALAPHRKEHQAAVRPEELPELARAVAGYEQIGDRLTRIALQLLMLTFVRTSELICAKWGEINLAEKAWVIPAERMKMRAEHIVPLSNQAIALLEELKPLSGSSQFLFPQRNPAKPISNNTMLFALYRLGYKGKMTGHGCRAVASTILNEQGFRGDVIERQLAHCERNAVRGAYNRAEYLPERKRMMQWWADYVENAASDSKVIVGNFG